MKEKKWSKNGMNQIINSGWKEFDKQTNCISTGNVVANTQYSSFIRPYSLTECNGFNRPEGYLMQFDMKPFEKYHIPERIRLLLTDKQRGNSVILYMFFTSNQTGIEPFGWVVTDNNYKLLDAVTVLRYGKSREKRYSALREAICYITA